MHYILIPVSRDSTRSKGERQIAKFRLLDFATKKRKSACSPLLIMRILTFHLVINLIILFPSLLVSFHAHLVQQKHRRVSEGESLPFCVRYDQWGSIQSNELRLEERPIRGWRVGIRGEVREGEDEGGNERELSEWIRGALERLREDERKLLREALGVDSSRRGENGRIGKGREEAIKKKGLASVSAMIE